MLGPYCSQLLGDMGADVIKVEQPGSGDETRRWGPPFVEGESSYFLSINRNKRSIAIDLKEPEGKDIIKRLVAVSDVVLENFLPGKMQEFGLGYESLREINAGIVLCSISGFGATGPLASRPGYDALISAMYGMLHITGEEGGGSVKPGVAITDVLTGLLAHGAVLAALRERDLTGHGQWVDTSLMEGQLSSLVNIGSNYLTTGQDHSKRYGTAHPSIVPYQAFKCIDGGEIMVCVGSDLQFKAFCEGLGMPEISINAQYKTNDLRVKNRDTLLKIIKERISSMPRKEWLQRFEGLRFPFGPVRSIKDAFEDPQAQFREMTLNVDHPKCGTIRMAGYPVKYSRTPLTVRLPPPLLGEHTTEILRDVLHMNSLQIQHFHEVGIVESHYTTAQSMSIKNINMSS